MPDSDRPVSDVDLSRLISKALRHEPTRYGLELDAEGWVPVDALLAAVHRQGPRWTNIGEDDLTRMIATSAKQRHELADGRIRARYGHSVAGRIARTPERPPNELFHGTSPAAAEQIAAHGLRPMTRQFVHLSTDIETAQLVGHRRADVPVIFRVDAASAHTDGLEFWPGNDSTWLADAIPARYLKRLTTH